MVKGFFESVFGLSRSKVQQEISKTLRKSLETVLFLITLFSHSSTLFLIPGLIGNSEFRNRFCGSKIMCSSCNKCVTCNKTFYISVSIFKPVAFKIDHNHVLNWQVSSSIFVHVSFYTLT